MGMKIVKYFEQWDLCWSNTPLELSKAKNMKKFQVSNNKKVVYYTIRTL